MHTTEEWAQRTTLNMTQAQTAQHKAVQQCIVSKKTHEGTVAQNLSMYEALHSTMTQKVKNSYRLIEKLQKRCQSVEQSYKKTKGSLGSIEKALQDKEVPLRLCSWRLEQREKRPLREQVLDNVESALEEEKGVLVDTQRRLAEALRKTKAMASELHQSLVEVRADIDQKMQALSVDEMCLRSTERSLRDVVERTPPAAGPRPMPASARLARHQVALQEGNRNEVQRHQEAERLNRAACVREDSAQILLEANAKLLKRCGAAAIDAQARSEKRMQERIQENQQMRRRLESEIVECRGKIEGVKVTMGQTKYQIRALAEPVDLTAACASWRKQRSAKESITDPVSSTLQEHRLTVLQAQQELVVHHQSEKTNLKELHDRRERLKEDLRDKTASLHIDLNCLTHEAVRVNGKPTTEPSQKKVSKAKKVDAAFVPGGAIPRLPEASLSSR